MSSPGPRQMAERGRGAAHDILIKLFIMELDSSVGEGLTSVDKGQLL